MTAFDSFPDDPHDALADGDVVAGPSAAVAVATEAEAIVPDQDPEPVDDLVALERLEADLAEIDRELHALNTPTTG